MFIKPCMATISPELRHSFLLSSSTVFMFSIQMASTGRRRRPTYGPGWCPSRVAKRHGEDAVGPLLAHRVLRAVQLTHGDGFGVQAVVLDLLFPVQTLVVELAERIRENGMHEDFMPYDSPTSIKP